MNSAIVAQESDNFPDLLVEQSESMPGWELTQGSFAIGPREFIYCRGRGFQGDPPLTPGFSFTFGGTVFRSIGNLNNAILASIRDTDLSENSRLQAALGVFINLDKQVPEFWPVLFNIARIHNLMYQNQQSMRYWQRVVKAIPEYAGGHYHLAKVASKLNQDTAVRYHFKRARELNPGRVRPLIGLGDYYLSKRSTHHAELYYNRALGLKPNNTAAITGKARILILQGQRNQARKLLLNFLQDHYDRDKIILKTTGVFYYIAELHYQLRDYKRSKLYFEKVLQFPESPLFLKVARSSIRKRIRKSSQWM